jgi:hypothetical protein
MEETGCWQETGVRFAGTLQSLKGEHALLSVVMHIQTITNHYLVYI